MNKTKINANDVLQNTAVQLVELMNKNGTDWVRKWVANFPKNVSGREYNGINSLILGMHDYKHKIYLTYLQTKKEGGTVVSGDKHLIRNKKALFFNIGNKKDEEDDVIKSWAFWRVYTVFNIDETTLKTDAPDYYKKVIDTVSKLFTHNKTDLEIADNLTRLMKFLKVDLKISNKCCQPCYRPSTQEVFMPVAEQFQKVKNFGSTLFHEIIHWTKHKDRCDRNKKYDTLNVQGRERYALEELVAETGSAMLCAIFGLEKEPSKNHAKYLNGWKERLSDSNSGNYLKTMVSQASKGVKYILTNLKGCKDLPKNVIALQTEPEQTK